MAAGGGASSRPMGPMISQPDVSELSRSIDNFRRGNVLSHLKLDRDFTAVPLPEVLDDDWFESPRGNSRHKMRNTEGVAGNGACAGDTALFRRTLFETPLRHCSSNDDPFGRASSRRGRCARPSQYLTERPCSIPRKNSQRESVHRRYNRRLPLQPELGVSPLYRHGKQLAVCVLPVAGGLLNDVLVSSPLTNKAVPAPRHRPVVCPA